MRNTIIGAMNLQFSNFLSSRQLLKLLKIWVFLWRLFYWQKCGGNSKCELLVHGVDRQIRGARGRRERPRAHHELDNQQQHGCKMVIDELQNFGGYYIFYPFVFALLLYG